MSSLTDVIEIIPPDADDEPEDIFASAPGLIFKDDHRNFHGDPGCTIVYKSREFGNIELKTADPDVENERQLFSHYLWNAGIKLVDLVLNHSEPNWSISGETVLELGAGVGLVGIVAVLAGAEKVVISDYPAAVVLDNIRRNAKFAIPDHMSSRYQVMGHEWGDLASPFAREYMHAFTRILAADCYWMPSQHDNLVRSMKHFLTLNSEGRIFVVSGFHTGRAKLAAFFDVAADEGLRVEEIYEEDVTGVRREWRKGRDGGAENLTERKRWQVIARLMR